MSANNADPPSSPELVRVVGCPLRERPCRPSGQRGDRWQRGLRVLDRVGIAVEEPIGHESETLLDHLGVGFLVGHLLEPDVAADASDAFTAAHLRAIDDLIQDASTANRRDELLRIRSALTQR